MVISPSQFESSARPLAVAFVIVSVLVEAWISRGVFREFPTIRRVIRGVAIPVAVIAVFFIVLPTPSDRGRFFKSMHRHYHLFKNSNILDYHANFALPIEMDLLIFDDGFVMKNNDIQSSTVFLVNSNGGCLLGGIVAIKMESALDLVQRARKRNDDYFGTIIWMDRNSPPQVKEKMLDVFADSDCFPIYMVGVRKVSTKIEHVANLLDSREDVEKWKDRYITRAAGRILSASPTTTRGE